jgi:hypothetical protein
MHEEWTMTEMRHGDSTLSGPAYSRSEVSGWVGWVIFAGVMMLLNGAFGAIAGFVALFKDEYYQVGSNGLVINVDYTTWGWVHIILGVAIALAGLALMVGQTWARVVAVIAATLHALAQFAFVAAYPLWALIMIAINVFVIYAVVVHGREARELR